MDTENRCSQLDVHCRAGSLENIVSDVMNSHCVHCRAGSLESVAWLSAMHISVHCRAGSLEIQYRGR